MLNTYTISNLKEFITIIEKLENSLKGVEYKTNLLFRGQNADFPPIPKLARLNFGVKNSSINLLDIERKIFKDFERSIVPLTEFKPENDWDLLALAQHHLLPTRLLDWTFNALIGIWFAVANSPVKDLHKGYKNGVVWILSPDEEDFNINIEKLNPFTIKQTKIFHPKVVSRRISAQSGVFTIHYLPKEGTLFRFDSIKSFKEKLMKVIIPFDEFAPIRSQLNTMGINWSSVFPDLDGLTKHLEWKYSTYFDERKGWLKK